MCKNYATQRRVIDEAKMETPEVYALYEQGEDLVGICKVYDRTTAMFFNVHRYGDLDFHKKALVPDLMDFTAILKFVRNEFGVGDPFIRRMYRVAAV